MQNLGGLAKNIYIGDMATAVFSEIAGQKNAGRGLFAETTASQVRHNNNFINNYRYTPTYYYLKDKMGKTDSKRYYFGKLSVAPNVDGIGIGYAYTTDIDEHAFNMGFVSSPDFEDFQTQLGELLISKSRDENYYKNILKGNSGITSVDRQFIASGITIEFKRGDRYKTPEEKDILNPDKHGDIKSLYKEEREKTIYSDIARENYKDFNISGKTIDKWDDVTISYNVDGLEKEHHQGLKNYSEITSANTHIFHWVNDLYENTKEELQDKIIIRDYLNDEIKKDYDTLTDATYTYSVPEEKDVNKKYQSMNKKHKLLFELYKGFRYEKLKEGTEKFRYTFYKDPFIGVDDKKYYHILQYHADDGYKVQDINFDNLKEGTMSGGKTIVGYNEGVSSTDSSNVSIITSATPTSNLIRKTNEFFEIGKIKTIINRFNTGDAEKTYENDDLVSSYNKNGLSRGRNLSLKNGDASDCRVWTAFKQYSKIKDLIRPFTKEGENSELSFKSIQEIQGKYGQLRPNNGNERLSNNTVLQPNGFVKITPTHSGGIYDGIKNYMFSIENLAWRDIDKKEFSHEQYGPNNGRIMWFPPYNLKFSENVNVNWNGNSFIGRGEQIYTYTNTERSGTLDFTLLIDHPSILNKWRGADVIDKEKEEKEMELLKYFAGCGELPIVSSIEESVETEPGGGKKEEPKITFEKYEYIGIPLFFPNAYSYTPNDKGDTINLEETIKNLKTYEYENVIGDFTGKLNANTSSINKQSFNWLNDFNKLPDESSSITYTTVTFDDSILKTYFPENIKDEVEDKVKYIIEKYFDGDNPRFKTVIEESEEDKKYKGNPSDNTSPYIYRTSGANGYTYFIKDKPCLKEIVIEKIKNLFKPLVDENLTLYSFGDLMAGKKIEIPGEISYINFGGFATDIGSDKNVPNNNLAKVRGSVIKSIFEKESGIKTNYMEEEPSVVVVDGTDVNKIEHKLYRMGYIIIEYKIKKDFKTINQAIDEGFLSESNYALDNDNKDTNTPSGKIREIYLYKNNDIYTYDNEYLYFKNLECNDNFIFKNIVDKVRFFDPAFHSMTPEGFNARLSFLHQCTRQGPTSKVVGTNFAGNLAFGRAPYCILRIGDFFHTKICIDSMSIQYDNGGGVQWDLNPEGVGVQPMYATVSLNFKFIGGQDISGPIERLQNAVSSNYYANTSIYDPRADYKTKEGDISTYIIE